MMRPSFFCGKPNALAICLSSDWFGRTGLFNFCSMSLRSAISSCIGGLRSSALRASRIIRHLCQSSSPTIRPSDLAAGCGTPLPVRGEGPGFWALPMRRKRLHHLFLTACARAIACLTSLQFQREPLHVFFTGPLFAFPEVGRPLRTLMRGHMAGIILA